MSCGLSVVELYGARMLYTRKLFETSQNSDDPLSVLGTRSGKLLTHGMYRTNRDSDEEQEPHPYPVFGMPLHRSPAVRAALSGLEEEKLMNSLQERDSIPSTSKQACDSRIQPGNKTSVLPAEAVTPSKKQIPERKKMTSRLAHGHRESARVHPYREGIRPPVHIVMKDEKPQGMYTSSSWPNVLLNPETPDRPQDITKSFSSPGCLDHRSTESSQTTPWLPGDQMHAIAIRHLSNVYTKLPITQVTFSSNITNPKPTTTMAFQNKGLTTSSSRVQQKDNFRRLTVTRSDKFSCRLSARDVSLQRLIRNSLASHGICVIDGLLGQGLASKMKKEVLHIHSQGSVMRGGILGTEGNETSTRGDVISWVDGTEADCQNLGLFCQKMDKIVSLDGGVTPAYTICGGTRAMVAKYPGGGTQYKLHVDNPNSDGRCLTCLYYLNENWDVDTMGGLLRIHAKTRGKSAEIAPIFDRLAVFYSDSRNPHEVLKCYANRYAITLWYFDRDERAKALERMDSMSTSSSGRVK